jgi:response regulator NasT
VFSEDDADAPLRQAMAAGVSAYVVAGLQRERLAAVLRVAIARFERDRALRVQLAEARQELTQRKVVDRAKGLLMKRHGIGEDEAYALLRKSSMDKGLKIADVARRLLDVVDLLG